MTTTTLTLPLLLSLSAAARMVGVDKRVFRSSFVSSGMVRPVHLHGSNRPRFRRADVVRAVEMSKVK